MKQLNKFLAELSNAKLFETPGKWIFRGQPRIYEKIIPGVGRIGLEHKEECRTYDQFRRAFPRFKMSGGDDWEMLALAQHHGLPTRLLDWTFNPLTALFFAVHNMGDIESDDKEGIVYALKANTESPPKQLWNKFTPFEFRRGQPIEGKELSKTPKRFWPKDISERVFAQEGLFVWFSNPSECLEQGILQMNSSAASGGEFDPKRLKDGWKIEKFYVPSADKAVLGKQLDFLGFTHARLFPDPDGLAKTLAWRMQLQS